MFCVYFSVAFDKPVLLCFVFGVFGFLLIMAFLKVFYTTKEVSLAVILLCAVQ